MIDYSNLTDDQWSAVYENRQRWIHALRCGGYQQAIGTLCLLDRHTHEPVGYCCLGVYVDTAHAEHWEQKYHPARCMMVREVVLPNHNEWSAGHLTKSLREELAMSHDFMLYLISMNDSRYSFAQIAELLESICGVWDTAQMQAVTRYLVRNRPAQPTHVTAQPPSE